MPALSPVQRWAMVVVRHFSGGLSVVSSSIIVYQIVLRYITARKRSALRHNDFVTSYHRLMLGFSMADILYAFWVGLSTLPVPATSGVISGFGTMLTCSAQGFFMQFSVATHLYMAALSTYFLLKIRYNVSDEVLYKRYEVWFHFIPWFVAIGTGSTGLGLTLFNPMSIPEMGCWLGPYPRTCLFPGGPDCTRGYKIKERITFYAFFLAHAWFFASFFVILINNVLIYHAFRHQERRNAQYLASRLQQSEAFSDVSGSRTFALPSREIKKEVTAPAPATAGGAGNQQITDIDESGTSQLTSTGAAETSCDNFVPDTSGPFERRVRRTSSSRVETRPKAGRAAATQSVLYVSTAFCTAIWIFMPFLAFRLQFPDDWRFFFAFMVSGVAPLQGFFNLIIFVRLEYLRFRSSNPTWSRLRCAKTCLFFPDMNDPGMFKKRRGSHLRSRT